MRRFLIVALVLGLGVTLLGAGCAKGDGGGGSGSTVAVPEGKLFGWSGEVLNTTSNVSKYALVIAKAVVSQSKAVGRWVLVVDKDPAVPANVTAAGLDLAKGTNGDYTVTVNLADGLHYLYGAYVNSAGEIVEENGTKVRFDLGAQPTGTFRVGFSQGGIRVFAYQGELWPEPVDVVAAGIQTSGNAKFTVQLSKKRFPAVSGNGGWALIVDGAAAAAWAATSTTDGRYAFAGELASGSPTLAFRWVDGGNAVQDVTTGKPYMPDLSVWDASSYDVVDGALLTSVYKGDLTKRGTKTVPGQPGNEGHGNLRWEISFDAAASMPGFKMFARLAKPADSHSYAAVGDWPLATTAEAMLQVDWYPGWYQPRSLLSKIPWDEDRTIQVLDMANGVSQRNIEFTGNEFTKTGQPHLINVVASAKAFIAPKVAAVTSAVGPPTSLLTSISVSENPVHVAPTGQPKVTRTLLANVTVNAVSYAINFSYHADITWQQGKTNPATNNWEPTPQGQEIAVVTRGTVFEGKTTFDRATFRISLALGAGNNPFTTDVEIRVY